MLGKWARTFQYTEIPGHRKKPDGSRISKENDRTDRKGGDVNTVESQPGIEY
jgi:hypothetical protein